MNQAIKIHLQTRKDNHQPPNNHKTSIAWYIKSKIITQPIKIQSTAFNQQIKLSKQTISNNINLTHTIRNIQMLLVNYSRKPQISKQWDIQIFKSY